MKKGHSKLSKNEPENIPWFKINSFLIESDSWTGNITPFNIF